MLLYIIEETPSACFIVSETLDALLLMLPVVYSINLMGMPLLLCD
jgi:hypothetical protein